MKLEELKQRFVENWDNGYDADDLRGYERLMAAIRDPDPRVFVRELLHNHAYYLPNGLYGDVYPQNEAALLLSIDEQDVLLAAGLKTERNRPIDFQTEHIGNRRWNPFNEGAFAEESGTGIGDYMTFAEANDPASGRIVPTADDFTVLGEQPSEWAIYQGEFGRLFDGRLFLPAGGFRWDLGGVNGAGVYGKYWSSSVCDGEEEYLHFSPTGSVARCRAVDLPTRGFDRAATGLQVRCLSR